MLGKKRRRIGALRNAWQLQAAKARFSELFRLVLAKGPQWVTRQGKEAVVVLSAEQFDALTRRRAGSGSLVEFFAQSPLAKFGVELKREKDLGREIEL